MKANLKRYKGIEKLARYFKLAVIVVLAVGCESDVDETLSSPFAGRDGREWFADRGVFPVAPIDAEIDVSDRRVQLGKRLFHDTRLSGDGTIACASCHAVSDGGDDGHRVSTGINGAQGDVNAPTVLNSALNFAQFWDGRAATLAEQAMGPIHNPVEMGSNLADVARKLAADAEIVAAFEAAYASGLTEHNIIDAIVTYEEALLTPGSPFDRYLLGDEKSMSEVAMRGFEEFQRIGCISCHQGKNLGGNMYQYFGIMGDYFADRGDVRQSDFGRYNVTGREEDRFKFKVPTLRNVALTAPYFHDGSAPTLEDAVQKMAHYQLGRPLSDTQLRQIVAFLRSLTGSVDDSLRE